MSPAKPEEARGGAPGTPSARIHRGRAAFDSVAPLGILAGFAEPTSMEAAAAAALASGPLPSADLIARVCRMPGVPANVAEHMAFALLGASPIFQRDQEGCWSLAAAKTHTASAVDPSTELAALRYLVVDVETTGLAAHRADRITEVAAFALEGEEITPVLDTLVNPERPIPPAITALTGITGEMVRHAPVFAEVCSSIVEAMDGRVFVAHNATFDWKFVSAAIARSTGRTPVRPRVCTVRLARALLPGLRRRSLDNVTYFLGIEISARHRASGDARATALVLKRLIRFANDAGIRTWGDLQTLLGGTRHGGRYRA